MHRLLMGILGLNPAVVIRLLRFGPQDALRQLRAGVLAIDPFQGLGRRRGPVMEERTIHQLVPQCMSAQLDIRHVETDGSVRVMELLAILLLARQREPSKVLEIGTYFGGTTLNLAINLPSAIIHTVDLPPDGEAKTRLPGDDAHLIRKRRLGIAFRGSKHEPQIIQHLGDTAELDFARKVGPVSFAFIDGSHTLEYAKNDSLQTFRLLRHPATVVWHDCSAAHPGVLGFLLELVSLGLPIQRVAGTTLAVLQTDGLEEIMAELLDRYPPPITSGS